MRSQKECGSWSWNLKDVTKPGLGFALTTAARMGEVLGKHDLLVLFSLEWAWFETGRGGLGIQ
ncbi:MULTISPECIES: hypothetical protein [unclassified Streptomyces]|uniref:hypothetical protein n=1 Tax=unclassified Streptomyces TaxID=2593676 RepID=UPI0024A975F3|nr:MULTISPECIES: hypothetical protein [unclassified Streptomyces]